VNNSTIVRVLAIGLTIPLATSYAQSDSVKPNKWSVSLGADLTDFDLRTRDPGVHVRAVGNLTRTWQSPGSRFGRHISLMLGADSPQGQENCYGCWNRVGKRYGSLTGGGSVDLFHLWKLTPYVQAGTGVYFTKLTGTVNGSPYIIPNAMYDRTRFSLGVNGGLGLKARFGSHEFFVEQMLHAFDVHRIDTGVYPFNFGIRF
jgi:hypothetical protein